MAWLLGGVLAALTVLPVCDLHFDCGCTLAHGASHCDIQVGGPPDCPWCARLQIAVPAIGLPYLAGAFSAYGLARKRGIVVNAAVTFVVIWAGMIVSGVATSVALGLPVFAGI